MTKSLLSVLVGLSTVSFAVLAGCAADSEDPSVAEAAGASDTPRAEQTGEVTAELISTSSSSSGGVKEPWCACKLNCTNEGGGPVLVKACKDKCDADNKCRKAPIGGGSSGIFIP